MKNLAKEWNDHRYDEAKLFGWQQKQKNTKWLLLLNDIFHQLKVM